MSVLQLPDYNTPQHGTLSLLGFWSVLNNLDVKTCLLSNFRQFPAIIFQTLFLSLSYPLGSWCIYVGELMVSHGGSMVLSCVPCFFFFYCTDWMHLVNLSLSSLILLLAQIRLLIHKKGWSRLKVTSIVIELPAMFQFYSFLHQTFMCLL